MDYFVRQLGVHRGAPRIYLDTDALRRAGLAPGVRYGVRVDRAAEIVELTLDPDGERVVARKRRGARELPVVDINSWEALRMFEGHAAVRIVILRGVLRILALASVRQARARTMRLVDKLNNEEPLATASLSFGAGISSAAIHQGLADAGIACRLSVLNEIEADFVELARAQHPATQDEGVVFLTAPMQEAALDPWLMARLPQVDLLEAGLPCSGASRAGAAKRHLPIMEAHPQVGHLVASAIMFIAAMQPAVFVLENVDSYASTASAAILRQWLRDAGYAVTETTLDARDFGSLESRVRWFLIAHPPTVPLDLEGLVPSHLEPSRLQDLLDPIDGADERFRTVPYLHRKAQRDNEAGKNFKMQFITPDASSIPVLRKGYHKGGSTDPRLVHPTDVTRSRLLTAAEHARVKGIDPQLIRGAGETLGHQVCGQSVDTRAVRALARRLGEALQQISADVQARELSYDLALATG